MDHHFSELAVLIGTVFTSIYNNKYLVHSLYEQNHTNFIRENFVLNAHFLITNYDTVYQIMSQNALFNSNITLIVL